MKIFKNQVNIDIDLSSISSLGEMLLFDIETTGLKKETTQIYLIGCGYFEDEHTLNVVQWLAESASDELDVLESFLKLAAQKKTLLHFNGDRFDIPYVRYKLDHYGMDQLLDSMGSLDIYKMIKSYKKFFGMKNMNQKSVEDFIGITRNDQFNGGQLIPYFYEYEKSGDEYAQSLLLLHNYEDVIGMAKLIPMLNYSAALDGGMEFESIEIIEFENSKYAELSYVIAHNVPVPVTYEMDGIMDSVWISVQNDRLTLTVPVYQGEVKVPLPDPENYYYLPAEDIVVHKDVGQFVDPKFRKKATSKNCFLKKSGEFIQTAGMTDQVDYLLVKYRGKPVHYIELTKFISASPSIFKQYAMEFLELL